MSRTSTKSGIATARSGSPAHPRCGQVGAATLCRPHMWREGQPLQKPCPAAMPTISSSSEATAFRDERRREAHHPERSLARRFSVGKLGKYPIGYLPVGQKGLSHGEKLSYSALVMASRVWAPTDRQTRGSL